MTYACVYRIPNSYDFFSDSFNGIRKVPVTLMHFSMSKLFHLHSTIMSRIFNALLDRLVLDDDDDDELKFRIRI